jgi:pimeloyl-ACP methyl ester carboxylesterase
LFTVRTRAEITHFSCRSKKTPFAESSDGNEKNGFALGSSEHQRRLPLTSGRERAQQLARCRSQIREGVMYTTLSLLCLLFASPGEIETQFVQVGPPPSQRQWWNASQKARAVVLIHGLFVHPFSKTNVGRAQLHTWQRPDCLLVKRLAQEADVFAFAYAQTVSADDIAECPELEKHLRKLRQDGYRQIVLIGHSAGGVIARQFVEDHPDSGVTKVIQVCAPNGGSSWAKWPTVQANQIDFLDSLTKPARSRSLSQRADKEIPKNVEFACIVGTGSVVGDGMVSNRSQYPPDLQKQGIPAYPFNSTHWMLLRSHKGVELVARLVRETQSRWDDKQVETVRRRLVGD